MNPDRPAAAGGFTLVEMLIAAAIGAALIAAAVIAFGALSGLPMRQNVVNVTLPSGIMADFYGSGSSFVTIGPNPNYFQAAQARRMKSRLMEDVFASSAVFCLGRNVSGSPELRPNQIAVPDTDFRDHATPSTFRDFLASADSALGDAFPEDQDGALLGMTNASIFMVGTLASILQISNTLTIIATYEVDFVPTSDPSGGTFASVRRYSGTNTVVPTDYYHAYYPGQSNGAGGFRPLAAFFGRKAAGSGAFSQAVNQPFTFVWWPDPMLSSLQGGAVPSASEASARANYTNMAGRTSLFFVLPAFPSL